MANVEVLLVDDEERYLKTTAKLLGREGFNATTAPNGIEALAILGQKEINIVVLDVMMPGMNGLEVLKNIKQQYPLIEVIMLTGHATVDSALKGIKSGAYDYVVKPADVNELISKLKRAFLKYEQSRQKIALV
ncbi:response regulator [bacterium]|nr:response regulator [bacterium]